MIDWAEKSSKTILIFLHCDSPTLKAMKQVSKERSNYSWIPAIRGEWLEISVKHDNSCKAYVVTHKEYFLPKLPKGYEMIHGGKKNSTIDLGFQGDDTGDNISDLNPYLSEMTVLYWVWKNAPQTEYVGFAHYSRFFTLPDSEKTDRSPENYTSIIRSKSHILTMQEAIDLLQNCDILVRKVLVYPASFRFRDENSVGYKIASKYIEKYSPKSLQLLRIIDSGQHRIARSMFFTRWKVFDEYCKWMFSFLIPSAKEYAQIASSQNWNSQTNRYNAVLSEEMTQVFLTENNLRIKYVNPIERPKVSTQEDPMF